MIRYLCQRIGEEMERFHEYSGLSNLCARNIIVKRTKKPLPENGKLGDFVNNSDELVCDIVSDNMWICLKYDVCCGDLHKYWTYELNVPKESKIGDLILVIEKLALHLWSYAHLSDPKFYYVLKQMIPKLVHAKRK